MRALRATVLIAAIGVPAAAQSVADPEKCLTKRGLSVAHAGKQYTLRDEACRDLFLSDPERYAQLFDAVAELEAAGKPTVVPRPSLVPS